MNILNTIMDAGNRIGSTGISGISGKTGCAFFLVGILAMGFAGAIHADSHQAAVPGVSVGSTVTDDAAALDRDLVLARRQRDLLATLVEIGQLLEQIRPLRQPVLSLLDGTLSPDDRWRAAMASMPPPADSADGYGREGEILQLRAEVESLRAEMALFLQTAPLPAPEFPIPDISPDPMEDGTMETSVPDWEPDRSGIRFVQLPAPGAGGTGTAETTGKPAVWLEADGMSAHLEQGRAVRFHGREIRLASLRPLADGRILITLDVDGAPHPITW